MFQVPQSPLRASLTESDHRPSTSIFDRMPSYATASVEERRAATAGIALRAGILHGTAPIAPAPFDASASLTSHLGHTIDSDGEQPPTVQRSVPGMRDKAGRPTKALSTILFASPDRRGQKRVLHTVGQDEATLPAHIHQTTLPASRKKDPRSLDNRHAELLQENPRAFYRKDGEFVRYVGNVSQHRLFVSSQPSDLRLTPHERAVQRLTKAASESTIRSLQGQILKGGATGLGSGTGSQSSLLLQGASQEHSSGTASPLPPGVRTASFSSDSGPEVEVDGSSASSSMIMMQLYPMSNGDGNNAGGGPEGGQGGHGHGQYGASGAAAATMRSNALGQHSYRPHPQVPPMSAQEIAVRSGQLATVETTKGDLLTVPLPPLPKYLQPLAVQQQQQLQMQLQAAVSHSSGFVPSPSPSRGQSLGWAGTSIKPVLASLEAQTGALTPDQLNRSLNKNPSSAGLTGVAAAADSTIRNALYASGRAGSGPSMRAGGHAFRTPFPSPAPAAQLRTSASAGRFDDGSGSAAADVTLRRVLGASGSLNSSLSLTAVDLVPTAGGGAATSRADAPYSFSSSSAVAAERALSGSHLVSLVAGHRAAAGADLPSLQPAEGVSASNGDMESSNGNGGGALLFTSRSASTSLPGADSSDPATRAGARLHDGGAGAKSLTSRAILAVAAKTAHELALGLHGTDDRVAQDLRFQEQAQAAPGAAPGAASGALSSGQQSPGAFAGSPSVIGAKTLTGQQLATTARLLTGADGLNISSSSASMSSSQSLVVGAGTTLLPSVAAAATVSAVLMGTGAAPPAEVAYFTTDTSLRHAARAGVTASGVLSTSRPGTATIVGGREPHPVTGEKPASPSSPPSGSRSPKATAHNILSATLKAAGSQMSLDSSSSLLQPALPVAVSDPLAEKVWKQAVNQRRGSIQAKGYSIFEEESQIKARALASSTSGTGSRAAKRSPNRLRVSSTSSSSSPSPGPEDRPVSPTIARATSTQLVAGDGRYLARAPPTRERLGGGTVNALTSQVAQSLDAFEGRLQSFTSSLNDRSVARRTYEF